MTAARIFAMAQGAAAPAADRWEKIGDMREPRWYPTLVTLPDGSLVTFSGIVRGNNQPANAWLASAQCLLCYSRDNVVVGIFRQRHKTFFAIELITAVDFLHDPGRLQPVIGARADEH